VGQGKLVRDNIPQIIRSEGLEPVTYAADTGEYSTRLRDKLREEVEEFLASDNDPEELADILEVLYALAELAGSGRQQVEQLRAAKAKERGGFACRIIWTGNRPCSLQRERVAGNPLSERLPQTFGDWDVPPSRLRSSRACLTPSPTPRRSRSYWCGISLPPASTLRSSRPAAAPRRRPSNAMPGSGPSR
jgi:predicted house-cleaning noncanonical NTP pyrophosphatase (MazG superfamily)